MVASLKAMLKHKYKCLNENCPGSGKRGCTGLFIADAMLPECPACGSLKLEDWGDAIGREGWIRVSSNSYGDPGASQGIDHELRKIADRHGLTDMSNKDGKPIRGAPQANMTGPTQKFAGIDIPMDAAGGACISLPQLAQPLKEKLGINNNASPMLGSMTKVVAEHKG